MNVNAFKVVDKETRYGTNWSIYYDHLKMGLNYTQHPADREHAEALLDNLTKLQDELQVYLPIYTVKAIIKMAPKSVGLMVFETNIAAKGFLNQLVHSITCIIINVEIIGKVLPQQQIFAGCGTRLQRLRKISSDDIKIRKLPPPSGTLFCKELLVLN